jgi:hypothetical protein
MPQWPLGKPDSRCAASSQRIGRRSLLAGLFAGAMAGGLGKSAYALSPETMSKEASTSEENRIAAVKAIPFDKLRDDVKEKLLTIVEKPSLYRRMPDQLIDCNPELFVFFIRYPEVIINIWDLMAISNVQIKRTAAFEFDVTDGAGTVSTAELVYGTKNLHLIYAEGAYEGPVLKRKLSGRCVLLLQSNYSLGENKRPQIVNRLDAFVSIDSAGAEMVAKTLHPVMGRTADHNFAETAHFLGRLSQAAETNGEGICRLADRLQFVEPKVRTEFQRLITNVSTSSPAASTAARAKAAAPELNKPSFKYIEPEQPPSRMNAPRQR